MVTEHENAEACEFSSLFSDILGLWWLSHFKFCYEFVSHGDCQKHVLAKIESYVCEENWERADYEKHLREWEIPLDLSRSN